MADTFPGSTVVNLVANSTDPSVAQVPDTLVNNDVCAEEASKNSDNTSVKMNFMS
jgi:hypothetical protein